MTTYLLLIWMTVASGPSFATHQFTNEAACESFAHWFAKDHPGAKALCIRDHELAI